MGDWSELLPELLYEMAKRMRLVEDFEIFGDVCNSWRAAADATKQDFIKSDSHVPLLMLAEKKDGSDNREFFSLARAAIWKTLPLPGIRGKKCLESKGWLITIGESGEMNLLNPFTGVQIDLPHQTTFPELDTEYGAETAFLNFSRAVLSATPDSDDCSLMLAHGGFRFAAYWRPGDKVWTRIEAIGHSCGAFTTVTYHNEKFYSMDYGGSLWVCNPGGGGGPAYEFEHVIHLTTRFPECFNKDILNLRSVHAYLVESSGELLIVTRDGIFNEDDSDEDDPYIPYDDDGDEDDPLFDVPRKIYPRSYGVKNFQVFQLDLIKFRCKKITSMGSRAIFLGLNSAISIDAIDFPGVIKPNCIYFTDDSEGAYIATEQGGGWDMGIYHLEDGRIERFPDFQSFSLIGPPLWVMPSAV